MLRFPALLCIAAALVWAQPGKLAAPYQTIVDLSRAAPPEFAADALLRLIESGKVVDRDHKRRLTEEAFRLADSATFRVRMRALPGIPQDTRSGLLSRAHGLQLDSLSLQSRAVKDMLAIDVPKARELFEEIPPPALTPLSCDDALVYDLTNFYQILGAIVNRSFTEKERAKQDHVNFLLGYLARVSSPLQFPPLADVIGTVSVTPAQREVLWSKFYGLLESMPPDGRAFSVLAAGGAQQRAELQAYLDKNRSAGCPGDRVSSSATASTPKLDRYWQSQEAQTLFADGTKLRFNSAKQPLSDSDRATPEWRQQLADYMSELANWGPSGEKSEADYFHQKCLVFVNLVDLIPPGPDRDEVVAAFVDFISNSGLELQSPVEWYLEANTMLERVRGAGAGEPDKVREAFEGSGDPVLSLSNELEKLLGRKNPDWAIPQTPQR